MTHGGSRPQTLPFHRRDGALACEDVALADIAAEFGTPAYVYSRRALLDAYGAYAQSLAGRSALVCYAVKAASNLAILNQLARAGSGFDIVSGGELKRVLAAGGVAGRVVFSGVGKTEDEIAAALNAGILCFNVESVPELQTLERIAARLGRRAPVSVRVNPDIDPRTHAYISTGLKSNKFGVAYADTLDVYRRAAASPHLEITGIDCHIGSQITAIGPYVDAASRVLDLVDALQAEGIAVGHLDFGGGLGIRYADEQPPAIGALIDALLGCVDVRGHADKQILVEPGRSIVGAAGVLLTRVLLIKCGESKNFAIVDAAMNDLMRPALYGAWMDVQAVAAGGAREDLYDVVGPVCESGDWLARERRLAIAAGDLLAILDAGAYGMSMASNYNSRPRPAEVMVDGDRAYCVRRRETVDALFAGESVLP